MLLSFFLLFFSCVSTALTVITWNKTSTMEYPYNTQYTTTTTVAAEETLSALQLVATPDYPVAAGQSVNLHCSASTKPDSVLWFWQRLENHNWTDVNRGRDLTLTEPEQSGLYRCRAQSMLPQKSVSPNHTVYIISMHATVGENLGIAAFVLSLMSLMINLAILFWLGWRRLGDTLTTSNTAPKGFPGPEKSPKGGFPKADSDGDVYMNYTSTNQPYADLDPTNMAGDNLYSSLS